jgi:hypothetical protein
MSEFKGTVAEVDSRDWKNGIWLYNFKLEGSAVVHNCGSSNPEVKVGEHIKFTERGRKVDTSTIERITAAEVETSPKPIAEPAADQRTTPVTDAASVGERIRRQAARSDAVVLVTTAMKTDLLPYPKSGKNQDKWDRMLDLIDETTNDLLTQEDKEWTQRSK